MSAATRLTLLDIVKANGCDASIGLVDEAMRQHPEIERGFARTIKGLNYPTLVRTALPSVAFRAANNGPDASKGAYKRLLIETFIMTPRWEADRAVADAYEDGAAAWMALEGEGMVSAAFATLASQMYYGTAADAFGFPGLVDNVDASMVVDAQGTTAATASSVWAVKWGPKDCAFVYGNNGQVALTELLEAQILGENGKMMSGYVQEIAARPGFQMLNIFAAGRIKNVTADASHTLTDAHLSKLLSLFPVGRKPDMFLMSRRSQAQLQASRTSFNATGAPAPVPDSAFNLPIFATDAIKDTETIA